MIGTAWRTGVAGLLTVVVLAGCSDGGDAPSDDPAPSTSAQPSSTTSPGSSESPTEPESTTDPDPEPDPEVESEPAAAAMMADVRRLAAFGPRLATSPAYARAADWAQGRLERLGYTVSRERVPVPAGDSWGTPVDAGSSVSLIADPAGLDPTEPHLVVGAHLDSVAVSPGAEDNASGVAVVLDTARRLADDGSRLPVRLILFGAEEPIGPADDQHHLGSQQHVADLTAREQQAIRGMAAVDRVGVPADRVPVCHAGAVGLDLRDRVVRGARAEGLRVGPCEIRTSDHWSYEKAGIEAFRLGSVDYAGYHSPDDTPDVVDPVMLRRTSEVLWTWLTD